MTYHNAIREGLLAKEFIYTLEHVPGICASEPNAMADLKRNAQLLRDDPRVKGVNIGDRVKSMDSFSTVECGRIAAQASGKVPLLHLAGKDREPQEARAVLEQALASGLRNLLLLTGDRVMEPTRDGRTRYFESVLAIEAAKKMAPDCVVAAAVSPFKYREEELANQYLKLAKKINAGADYIVTNCGWDMRKLAELIWYRDGRGWNTPIVANLLLPTFGWARGIHSRRLPGVYMSDSLFAKISEEQAEGKPQAREISYQRLALQVVGVQRLGYAGVQLSGVDTYEDLCDVMERVEDLKKSLTTLKDWEAAWSHAHTLQNDETVCFSPPGGVFLFEEQPPRGTLQSLPTIGNTSPSIDERAKYQRMRRIHDFAFDDGSAGRAVLAPAIRLINALPLGSTLLLKAERATKKAALGCETCGYCRVDHLFYNCPETCPKGLANGPCAGTDDNVCEFKDRECIHNAKYRLAKEMGKLADLENVLVPAVEGTRGTSSWLNLFEGKTPKARHVGDRP